MTDALKAELAQRISTGRALVVVGTGVSLAATGNNDKLASWKGLISSGIDRCVELGLRDAKWGEQQNELLKGDLDDLLGVAEQVARRLGWKATEPCGGDWNLWLRKTVGGLRANQRDLIEAIGDLGTPIATLNYDNLLTDVIDRRPLTWQRAERWLPVLDGRDEGILHLHGHWDQPSSVVLGIRSYDAVLGRDLAQHMQRALASFQSLAFIGCSATLEDPNFSALLAWMREQLTGAEHSHYLLVRKGETLPAPEPRLREARIVPLYYGSEHTDLLPYIRSLAPARSSKSGGTSGTSGGSSPLLSIATNNLPPHNPDFVGREGVLAQLRQLLTAGQGPAVLTQAITGLGGIGKTQTARAYAYRHLADYALVWWLRAQTPSTLAADYAALAGPLGLDPGTADQAQLIAAIRQRLQAMPGWLLVFDNVEDPALPQAWLPGTGGGHALITSRRTDWRGLAKALSLELMPEDEALQLLTGRPDPRALSPVELAAAKDVAAELGHLPLALAQARAYMAETGRSLAGYLRLFRASRPADFAADAPSPDYPASYATTWRISIEAAAAACPAARPLLELLAFLAPDPLPIEVLGADPAAVPEGLHSEHARDDAVAALRRYSLIAAEDGEITVHRLVQAVTRDGLDEAARRGCAETSRAIGQWHFAASALGAHELAGMRDAAAACAGCDGVGRAARGGPGNGGHGAEQNGDLSRSPRRLGRGRASLPARPRYRREDPRPRPPRPRRLRSTTSPNSIRHTGRYAEAEPLYQRAIAIGEKTLGPDDPNLATRLNNLANLYQATGRYAEAEPLFQRAIAIIEKTLGPDHPNLAIAQQPRRTLSGHRPLRRGRAPLRARHRHRREDPRPRPPRPRHLAQQPRRSLSGHRPPGRGRAPLPARHRHLRGQPAARSSQPRHRPRELCRLARSVEPVRRRAAAA